MSEKYLGENSTPILINQIKENCTQKRSTLPIASIDELGNIYQYTGTTSGSLVHGCFYECVSDGQDPATYNWVAVTGTASLKNSTDRVSPNNTDLVESQSVYSAINTALSSIYTPRGEITCAELTSELLISDNIGNVYETSDSGTTTALFLQGAGHPIAVGSNVGVINAGQGRILFNLMANAFDLTDYQKKDLTSAVEGQTTVESALGALSTDKQPKDLTTTVESATTVEGALGALSDNKQAKTLTTSVESQTTVEGALGALSTNKATQAEVNDIVNVLGAKNLLPNNAISQTINGVTFTVNADGSVTVNGTATANAELDIATNITLSGDYILSDAIAGESGHYWAFANVDSGARQYILTNAEMPITVATKLDYFRIKVFSGETVSNVTFKPMIRLASDPDNTYVPYAMTNQQITKAMPLNVGVNNKLISSLSRIVTVEESTANPNLLNTLTGGNVKFAWGAIKLQNNAPHTIDNEVYVISYAENNISQVGDTAVIAQIAIARSGSGYDSTIYKRLYCYHGGTYKWSPWEKLITESDLNGTLLSASNTFTPSSGYEILDWSVYQLGNHVWGTFILHKTSGDIPAVQTEVGNFSSTLRNAVNSVCFCSNNRYGGGAFYTGYLFIDQTGKMLMGNPSGTTTGINHAKISIDFCLT